MNDFLFLLAKTNLAMGAAILVVFLLRRPVRIAFHAATAYALWLLVPAMALANLLPARLAAPGTAASINLFGGPGTAMPTLPILGLSTPHGVPLDVSGLIFGAWLVGAVTMALHLMRLQHDFHHAERAGTAGPAVAGFLQSRIVVPADFTARFDAGEQAAILAHEQAHLLRQDARVNAVVAFLRCLCWFNPLVHLASVCLRHDQELACDAAAVKSVPRLDYAHTLLKAQMPVVATPLGCAWPGSEHPLAVRMALLKRPAPRGARRLGGALTVMLLTLSCGFAAWAQQGPFVAENDLHPEMANRDAVMTMYGKPFYFMTLYVGEMQEGTAKTQFTGPVRMEFPYGSINAASGSFGDETGLAAQQPDKAARANPRVTLNDVEMTYGNQTLRGRTLIFDLQSRLMTLDGRQMPSGIPDGQPSGTFINLRLESGARGTIRLSAQ